MVCLLLMALFYQSPLLEAQMSEKQIENITVILPVKNLQSSMDHFEKVLGFKKGWQTEGFGSVSRDGFDIYLAEGQSMPGQTWLWMGVEDADVFYKEYLAADAKIVMPPSNFSWAYEFRVADLDGNIIRVASGPRRTESDD